MPPTTIPELLDRLTAGTPVILPTPRAAADLRFAFDHHQRARNQASWEPPAAWSWQQWTSGLWNDLILNGHEQRLLLNPAQELALWREVVAQPLPASEATPPTLGQPDSLAKLASEAFHLAARYNALARPSAAAKTSAAANTLDTRTFATWADNFTRLCTARNYLSAALLDHALLQHLDAGTLTAPASLVLAGFLEHTPSQQSLLDALTRHNTHLEPVRLAHPADTSTPVRAHTIAPTETAELTAAARWVRSFLEDRQTSPQPARVAIFLPQPAELREALEAVLRDILAPELHDLSADLSATPWEFSTGPSLAVLPLTAAALSLAHWAAHPLPLHAITALLLSPFLGQNALPTEREASARFDAALRHLPMLQDEFTLPQLLALAARPDGRIQAQNPSILAHLRDVHTVLQRAGDLHRPRSFADWGEFLTDLIRSANWPGDRPPNPIEFEAVRAWESLLDSLATLDFQGRRVPYSAFLQELDRQAAATAFHPPATHAAVQIMGLSEADGCTFDAVVVLRCSDANLPASEHTNPLLPWSLQRSLHMPGADPAAANARAHDRLTDLLARSGSALFTLAAEDADGPLRPSPILSTLGLQPLTLSELLPDEHPPIPLALEDTLDDTPVPSLPSGEVLGGSNVLKLQAACAFRAFAEVRLHSAEPDTPTLGLDAGESGSFLHKALENFWQQIHTQDALRQLDSNARRQRLSDCIDNALPRRIHAQSPWDAAYLHVQKQRLLSVLDAWLDLELQRSPFEVLAIEDAELVSVGPLQLKVRLDRIDRVLDPATGEAGFLYIDYKSGLSGHPADWETDRPQDPQLPLYALLGDPDQLKGLAFARVRVGKEMRWLGIQAEDGLLPNPRSNPVRDIPALIEDWRFTLTRLAEDFAAGLAEVSPRDFRTDCARCTQRLLCRLDPLSLDAPSTLMTLEDDPSLNEYQQDADG